MDIRRDLTGRFCEVLKGASIVFPFAPWALERVKARLGSPAGKVILLPCATDLDQPLPPILNGSGLISVFHLMSYKPKNLKGIVSAVKLLQEHASPPSMSIIGGGDDAQRTACEAAIRPTPSIHLEGAKDRAEIRAAMNAASGFVLPSLRETFGLVFVEALFAGLPIIYPRGTAVDGYFDGAPFALPVNARDPRSIVDAMSHLIQNENALKAELSQWQSSEAAASFQRPAIANRFAAGLSDACSRG